MAEKLLDIKAMDVAKHMGTIMGLKAQAEAYSKMGAPKAPGVPDIKGMAKKLLDTEGKVLVDLALKVIIALLLVLMTKGVADAVIPEINKGLKILNKVITGSNTAVGAFIPIVTGLFAIIIALTIVYVVAKIISMIPAVTIGLGAGIAFTAHISISTELMNMASAILQDLWPIAFAIISVMIMLLAIYGLVMQVVAAIKNLKGSNDDITSQSLSSMNMTGNELADSGADGSNAAGGAMGGSGADGSGAGAGAGAGDGLGGGGTDGGPVDGGGGSGVLVECTLPSGEVKMMTAEECLAAGGTFGDLDSIKNLNSINDKINDINLMLGACLLPDGTVKQMTPEDCAAAGGCFGCAIDPNLCWGGCQHGLDGNGSKQITCQLPDGGDEDISVTECNNRNGIDKSIANILGLLNNLKSERDAIINRLGNLSGFQLGENVITSLKHPDRDITVGKATSIKGKRKGFYSNDIK